jgi:ribosomal protein S18 acetylase RimI-like enzyme
MPGRRGREIRSARPSEADLLTGIALRAKASWGYDEDYITVFRRLVAFSLTQVSEGDFQVLEHDGALLGFYELRAKPPILEHLWVEPSAHGRGIGRALVEHALRRARTLGAEALEVESEPHAVGFYQRLGFRRIGERESTIQAGTRLPLLSIAVDRS